MIKLCGVAKHQGGYLLPRIPLPNKGEGESQCLASVGKVTQENYRVRVGGEARGGVPWDVVPRGCCLAHTARRCVLTAA